MLSYLTRTLATATIVAFSFASAWAESPAKELPAGTYNLDNTHASLIWKVNHLGLSHYTARFTDFDATIDFNPEAIDQSHVTVTIDPTSVTTDYPNAEEKDFDAKLAKGEKWFNSEAFPEINFKSTGITITGDNTADITGDLTFLGITKPVTLDTTLNGAMKKQPFSKKPTLGFSATTTIKRSEWGFSTYVPTIGDEVTVLIEAEFYHDGESEDAKE